MLDGGNNHQSNPSTYTIESSNIAFETPTKIGAKFISWYSDENLINEITNIPQGSKGDTTIYAKWELDIFDIKYVLSGGNNHPANPSTYTIESNSIAFESPSKIGAKFIAWYGDKDFTDKIINLPQGSFGDTLLYAKWELIDYNIQYMLDGGNNHSANPSTYTIESNNITFESPTKIGAKFIAWYNNIGLINEIAEIPKGSVGDTTIYAKWVLDTFDIQYILDGGINNQANPVIYTIETDTITFRNPDKQGFIFDGWFINSNYSDSIRSIPKGNIGDITIYAKWIEIFDVNFIITTDGINPARDIDIVINKLGKLSSDILGLADTLMPDGSTFDYSIELNGIVIDKGLVSVSGSDVTIRAEIVDCYLRWYDVIFCDNGKGLWSDFIWYKDNNRVSEEQFFHNPGGIKAGEYSLYVKSIAGVEYIWKKEYKSNETWEQTAESYQSEITVFPNPINRGSNLNILLSENTNQQSSYIIIINVNGALIQTIKNPMYMNEINIDSKFSSGVYHVILIDDKNKWRTVKDFIVN